MKISPHLTFKSLDSATSGFPYSWAKQGEKVRFPCKEKAVWGERGCLRFPRLRGYSIELATKGCHGHSGQTYPSVSWAETATQARRRPSHPQEHFDYLGGWFRIFLVVREVFLLLRWKCRETKAWWLTMTNVMLLDPQASLLLQGSSSGLYGAGAVPAVRWVLWKATSSAISRSAIRSNIWKCWAF